MPFIKGLCGDRRGSKCPGWRGGGVLLICTNCKKEYRRPIAHNKAKRPTCSFECYYKIKRDWMLGSNHFAWKGGVRHKKGIIKKYRDPSNPKLLKREWRIKNKEKIKEYRIRYKNKYKEWRDKNKDKVRMYKRARKFNSERAGKLSLQIVQLIYEDNIKKFGTLTCYLCLLPIQFGNDHLEHKTPLSRGGLNLYENLAVSCAHCNRVKSNKTEEEYSKVRTK